MAADIRQLVILKNWAVVSYRHKYEYTLYSNGEQLNKNLLRKMTMIWSFSYKGISDCHMTERLMKVTCPKQYNTVYVIKFKHKLTAIMA